MVRCQHISVLTTSAEAIDPLCSRHLLVAHVVAAIILVALCCAHDRLGLLSVTLNARMEVDLGLPLGRRLVGHETGL